MYSPKAQANTASPLLQQRVKPSFPLTIQIRSVWILLSSAVLSLTMAAITYVLIDGFDLTTVNATKLSDDDKSDMLDKYNSYTAAVAGWVTMPMDTFSSSLLPLFFLCYWTKDMLGSKKSWLAWMVPMAVGYALTWLLGQGLSALNVQFSAPTYEYIIQSSDLADTSSNATFGLSTSSITRTTHVAGIPSNNTILRNAIRMQIANTSSTCTSDSGPRPSPEVTVRYGFPLNSWLGDLMSESVACERSLSFSMSTDFSKESISASAFPGGDMNKAAQLFTYGIWAAFQHFGEGFTTTLATNGALQEVYTNLQSSDGVQVLSNMQNLVSNITEQVEERVQEFTAKKRWDATGIWTNISVPDIAIEFADFQLSPLIKFESVTFDLPVLSSIMKSDLVLPNSTDGNMYWDVSTSNDCNDFACLIRSSVVDGTLHDQVRMVPLCMTGAGSTEEDLIRFNNNRDVADTWCHFPSNNSALVVSLARHISVDDVNYSMPAYEDRSLATPQLIFKNPRKTYSVTVGRLSWEKTDLAKQYGAKCATGSNCDGLYFPLSNDKQHLVLGEAQVPKVSQPYFTSLPYEWPVLAIAQTQTSSTQQADIVYPPNYNFTGNSDPWMPLTTGNCSYLWAPYVNTIIQNHVYSKDPVQPAYTAALFWLFQNAALRDVLVSNATTGGTSAVRLAFEGNIQWLSSHASIPLTSAIFAFAGNAIILLLGLFTSYWAHSSQKQAVLTDNLTVNSVAEMIVGAAQFPPYLVNTRVLASNGTAADKPYATDEFEINEMTLRHKTNPTVQNATFYLPDAAMQGAIP